MLKREKHLRNLAHEGIAASHSANGEHTKLSKTLPQGLARRGRQHGFVLRDLSTVDQQLESTTEELNRMLIAEDWSGARLVTMGWGDHGRLGHGNEEARRVPESVDELCERAIEPGNVSCGSRHTLFVTTNSGKVFACGDNGAGQLGCAARGGKQLLSRSEKATRRVSTLLGTYQHPSSPSVDVGRREKGGVRASGGKGFGSSYRRSPVGVESRKVVGESRLVSPPSALTKRAKKGDMKGRELGVGSGLKPRRRCFETSPVAVDMGSAGFITSVACGSASSYAVSGTGMVYAWGLGSKGQLGLGDTENRPNPVHISSIGDRRMKFVCAGHLHCLAMTNTGKLYSWGFNAYGQLGHGDHKDRHVPTPVNALRSSRSMHVAAGFAHSLCVCATTDAEVIGNKRARTAKEDVRVVFAWGDNSHGQLGFGCNRGADRLKFMKKGGKLGDDCELTPTVASGVSETYTPFTSHKPRTKQGGKLSSSSSRSSSKKKKGGGGGGQQRLPSRVGAGKFFSAVLMASSTVWTFGNNDYGQLGQGDLFDRDIPKMIEGLSNVEQLACGSRHTLTLNKSGHVYGWGYNSYGELGVDDLSVRTVPTLIKALEGLCITSIAAGERHSAMIGEEAAAAEELAFHDEKKHESITLSNEFRTATRESETNGFANLALIRPQVRRGKYRWTVSLDRIMSDYVTAVGICYDDVDLVYDPKNQGSSTWAYLSNGMKLHDGWEEGYGSKYWWTDKIDVEVDMDLGTIRFYRNGQDQGVAFYTTFDQAVYLYVAMTGETDTITIHPQEDDEDKEVNVFQKDTDLVCDLHAKSEAESEEKLKPLEVFFRCSTCKAMSFVCRSCAYICHKGHSLELVINKGEHECMCGSEKSCQALPKEVEKEGKGGKREGEEEGEKMKGKEGGAGRWRGAKKLAQRK